MSQFLNERSSSVLKMVEFGKTHVQRVAIGRRPGWLETQFTTVVWQDVEDFDKDF